MKAITTELVDNGEKQDAKGRKLVTAKERAVLIAAYEQSGLTQKAFAQREGVKYTTFTAWLMRYRRQAAKPGFTELRLPMMASSWAIEIALPNGIVIRTNEVANVNALVSALRAC